MPPGRIPSRWIVHPSSAVVGSRRRSRRRRSQRGAAPRVRPACVAVEDRDRLRGQPCAASTILSSGAPVGSSTIAMPSSSRSNTPGAQNEQLPEPMQLSRSILMSSATTILPTVGTERSARDLAEPGVPRVDVRLPRRRRIDDPRRCAPSGRRRSSTSRARTRAGRGTRRRARRLRGPRTRAPASPVQSASASTQPSSRVPPPVATMRRAGTGLASIMRRVANAVASSAARRARPRRRA